MGDRPDVADVLQAGAAILAVVLSPAGFMFRPGKAGRGSGGEFAAGRFVKGGQYVEFHLRYSLGLVSYGWDTDVVSHRDYLRALGVRGAYPGYSREPLDGFRHLAADLTGPLSGFVDGNHAQFEHVLQSVTLPQRHSLP